MRHHRNLVFQKPVGEQPPGISVPYSWGVGSGIHVGLFGWKDQYAPQSQVVPQPIPFDYAGWVSGVQLGTTGADANIRRAEGPFTLIAAPGAALPVTQAIQVPAVAYPVPNGHVGVVDSVETYALDLFFSPIPPGMSYPGALGMQAATGTDVSAAYGAGAALGLIWSLTANGIGIPFYDHITHITGPWGFKSGVEDVPQLPTGAVLGASVAIAPIANLKYTKIGLRVRGRWIPWNNPRYNYLAPSGTPGGPR